MIKVIRRNMSIKADELCPEHNLSMAVIGSAVTDLLDKTRRRSAEYFFDRELFDTYCNWVGLNPEATKKLLVQGGFLGD